MAFEFDKCCFCIELRTGCLIIGYLNLIGNIAVILMSILSLAAAGEITAQGKDDESDETQTMGAVMFAVIAILLVFFIQSLTFTIVLLVGLHQYKRGHVKAYLIYTVIFIVLYIIKFFAGFAEAPIEPDTVVEGLISILLSIYFLLVIRSYYLKMDDPANKPAVYNTA